VSAAPAPAPATAPAAIRPAVRVAVVGFSGKTEIRWLRWLKPGFRHCLVLLWDGRDWVVYDPLAHVTELVVVRDRPDFCPIAWLLEQGCLPVPVRPATPAPRLAPVAPYTCVEAVKRVLGLHARFVLTPWQLFRRLTGDQKKVLDLDKK
jgi:hypothetical protein